MHRQETHCSRAVAPCVLRGMRTHQHGNHRTKWPLSHALQVTEGRRCCRKSIQRKLRVAAPESRSLRADCAQHDIASQSRSRQLAPNARERGCCGALVLRRADAVAVAILSIAAAEAAVRAHQHACAHELSTARCSTRVRIVADLWYAHWMCGACARDVAR